MRSTISNHTRHRPALHNWQLLLLILLIWILLMAVALSMDLLMKWLHALDQVLDPSLFATLAGLSLAAAAFLVAGIQHVITRLPETEAEMNKTRPRAEKEVDFDEGDGWFRRRDIIPLQDEIDFRNFSFPVTEYLTKRRSHAQVQLALATMNAGTRNFIASFLFLITGLIETLSLDLWANATTAYTTAPITFMSIWFFFTHSLAAILSILDISIGFVLLIAAIYFLVIGALNLKDGIVRSL